MSGDDHSLHPNVNHLRLCASGLAGRWHGRPVMPALVRWRLRGGGGVAAGRHVAADFRTFIPASERFRETYARWTRQNKVSRNGRYRIVLARGCSSADLRPGTYTVDVAATDMCGNTGRRSFSLTIR